MEKSLEFDIAVVGGGPAGTVAAIAAAREGASVILVEQYGYLGGMLTVAGTGPLMTFHAGNMQVVRGIPDEIITRLKIGGFSPGHMVDFAGYASSVTPFDAEGMKLVMEQMAEEAGVTLLYHTVYTGCLVENGCIQYINSFSKNGFFKIKAKVYIDCSADADLANHAGVSSVYGRETDHLAQPMTMNIKIGDVNRDDLIKYVKSNHNDMLQTIPFNDLHILPRTGIQGAYSLIEKAKKNGDFDIARDFVLCFETNTLGEVIVNMSRVVKRCALDPFDLTEAEIEGRNQAHQISKFLRKYIPGFEHSRIISTGPHIGIRESRKINGRYKLTAEDLMHNKMFADAIAMGGYPIDIHSPDGNETKSLFLANGSWYSIPYRCLVTNEISNLIVAGRCISATHEALAAVRVSPIVMAVGQAAGTAAAQGVASGQAVNWLNTDVLRELLKSRGVFLDEYHNII